jgi:hypothetical protein
MVETEIIEAEAVEATKPESRVDWATERSHAQPDARSVVKSQSISLK